MSQSEGNGGSARLQVSIRDLLFAMAAIGAGVMCAQLSSWDVGVSVGALLGLLWRVRNTKYAVVPGATVGALAAWATLSVSDDASALLSRTAAMALVGAAVNCLWFRYWFEGLFGLLIFAIIVGAGVISLMI